MHSKNWSVFLKLSASLIHIRVFALFVWWIFFNIPGSYHSQGLTVLEILNSFTSTMQMHENPPSYQKPAFLLEYLSKKAFDTHLNRMYNRQVDWSSIQFVIEMHCVYLMLSVSTSINFVVSSFLCTLIRQSQKSCSIVLQVSYEVIRLDNIWVHPYSLHYDIQTNNMYFSDLLNRSIHRINFNDNQFFAASIENGIAPSFIIPSRGRPNRFIISDQRTISEIEWNGSDSIAKVVREIFSVEAGEEFENNNFNIAKASPHTCQFYGGTFRGILCSSEPGKIASLYDYSKLTGVKRLVKDLKISGGLDWNIAKNLFYHVESCELLIREYDWNPITGDISELKVVRIDICGFSIRKLKQVGKKWKIWKIKYFF